MATKNVKISLNNISKKLSKTQDQREFLLKNTREVISICSKTIIAVHKNDIKTAKSRLSKAEKLLKKYRKKSTPEVQKYLVTPEQEFVEAASLISIVEKKEIPTHKKLNVMEESYVLGLLDCIGELKRMIFDRVRNDNVKEATRIFDIMEDLYDNLYGFSMYDKVVKEARRKVDIARKLVDDARAVITEEKRRSELNQVLTNSKK